jgi:hypothetical protein
MKISIILTLLLAFIIGLPPAILANYDGYQNASQWCTANDDLLLKNHGACVSYLRACKGPDDTGPMCACKELLDSNPDGFYAEYNNLNECVNHLKDGYVPMVW